MRATTIWLLSLLIVAGCSSTSMHTPTAVPIEAKMSLNEFATGSTVSLVNAEGAAEEREWTGAVITFLSEQLEQRGAVLGDDAPLQLSLDLVKARRITAQILLLPLAAPEGCEVTVRVEAGNGYVQTYNVQAGAYFWQKACDKGVTTIVVDILNDSNIREYLDLSDRQDAADAGP